MRCAIVVIAIQLAFICGASARPNNKDNYLRTLLLNFLDQPNKEVNKAMEEPQSLEVKDAVKRLVIAGCQSGQSELGYTTTEKAKSRTVTVTFSPSFAEAPALVWGLTHLDSSISENVRINSEVTGLTATGFSLKINAWGATLAYNAKVSWMACPK